jgi:hypothetical protein
MRKKIECPDNSIIIKNRFLIESIKESELAVIAVLNY